MHISSILEEQFIAVNLPVTNKEDALNNMIDMFRDSPKGLDMDKVRTAVLEREKVMSTGVGHGFAIPHGKTDALTDIIAAFAITAEPLDFQALDDQPVRLIFLLVGKESHMVTHLKLLSRVSRLMNSASFRKKLLQAQSPAEVLEFFNEEEEKYFETT